MSAGAPPPWHSLTGAAALDLLASRPSGLHPDEAAERLARCGPNSLPPPAGVNPVRRFLAQFHNALIYFLLAAAIAAGLLGHLVDTGVILAVVIVNAIVGFLQEGKAERALAALAELVSPRATVLRDGERRSIDVAALVPGDIVLLEAGDRVPADLRLLRTRACSIDEALLTGESVTAQKREDPVPAGAAPGDRACMAFSGTLVATGQASGVVTATGTATEIGRISGLLRDVTPLTTPLLRQMDRFAHRFTLAIFACAAGLFAFAVLVRDFGWSEALVAVVALSIGAIPEGLPAVITITLAIGVQRMAARKAVVRKLPAVETLGATSVICTDKTGTLTRNEMTVRSILLPAHELHVSGAGYAPDGVLTAANHDDDPAAIAAASDIIRCGLLCNDARLRPDGAGWAVEGDPMEGALLVLAMKAGMDPGHVRSAWTRIDEIPFDAAHRFMATLHCGPDGAHVVFIKGAPEALLALIGNAAPAALWEAQILRAASAGERVLGFAMKRLDRPAGRIDFADLVGGVEPLGLLGFIDPPRNEVIAAIAQCRTAGIAVKMITGDHAATALAIARQVDLAEAPRAMNGTEVDALSDAGLAAIVGGVSIFARTTPEQKLRIVRALQAGGAIVAMTGDGVNDAPSLKQADVGTAMGIKGTEAARQAAQIVLLDDNFASIVAAVREGRTVHDNIRKVIAFTLPTNGGEAIAVLVAILAGLTLPMTATQILWINLVTTVSLDMVLAFEPAEPGVMRRPPRRPDAPLLTPFLLWRVLLVSALFALVLLVLFFEARAQGADVETARTMVVNMLVVAELFYLFNVRFLHMGSISWRGLLGTPAVLGAIGFVVLAQLAFTYLPVMNALFASRPLTLGQGALIIALGVALLLLLEGEKLVLRRLGLFRELREVRPR